VKSLRANKTMCLLYVECFERECDADEENGKQSINLEVILDMSLRQTCWMICAKPGKAKGDIYLTNSESRIC
jgi:hypothetical protein